MKILTILIALVITYSTSLPANTDGTIEYSSVSTALERLKKIPGSIFSQQDGWSIISQIEDGNHVIWFFAPEEHAAHPAVVKKTITVKGGGIETITTTLCEAPKPKCDKLIKQFMNMTEVYK